MNRDKKILYVICLAVFAVLLLSLFVDFGSSKIVTACLLLLITPIVMLVIKKRTLLSIKKREVLLINTAIAVIYVVLVHMSGLFLGYYINPYCVNSKTVFSVLLPVIVIIIASELIRAVFLAQKNKLVDIITYLSCVLVEMLAYSNIAGIMNFNMFMDYIGMTLFPALVANIFYNYQSKRFGALPNISFRIITTAYIYVLSDVSAMSDALNACIKMILPIVMLAFVSALYEKKKKTPTERKSGKFSVIATSITVAFLISIAMLISCQFHYGALVIATESMTGEINKGDMIIYESYDDQPIREGQVIVFLQYENKIVHRVVMIEDIDGERRYYTKGDANPDWDSGYRTESDIVGLTDMKIAYIGHPTLWLRELISND